MNELSDERLNEYLDGVLDAAARQDVETQLAESPEAQVRLAELQTLFVAFGDMAEVPLTRDLSGSVLAALHEPVKPETVRWLRYLPWLQLTAVILLILLFWATIQGWLLNGRTFLTATLPTAQLPDLMIGETVRMWSTAVWQSAQTAAPQFNLAINQWLLLTLALVVWLAGNRLLFTNHNGGSHG
ncbi:MAG: hypothetical protein GY796_31010 [Chloroflexi bacterium]|nr:hypothetical protein [Chloroflexota bacterium]